MRQVKSLLRTVKKNLEWSGGAQELCMDSMINKLTIEN